MAVLKRTLPRDPISHGGGTSPTCARRYGGGFSRLNLEVEVWSRKIVAWEVALRESSEIAPGMIARASTENGVDREHPVILSDNGGQMTGATLLATLAANCRRSAGCAIAAGCRS